MEKFNRSKQMKENNPMKNLETANKMRLTLINKGLRKGNKNNNWKGGRKIKKCYICGKDFLIYPSQKHQKTCSKKCADISRHINSAKTNLGKTKYNCKYLMKMSKERTGIPRTKELKKRLSKIVKEKIHQPENWKRFIEGNKNRNMDFMKNKEWYEKCLKTKKQNIKNGKYVYKNICMRSNWEIKVAKWLDSKKLHWKYEPKVFYLSDIKKYYIPDFYVDEFNSFVEVKGFMDDRSFKKINGFKKINNLILFDKQKLKELNIL